MPDSETQADKPRFKHVVEYGFLRGFAFLFRLLPYRIALCVGWLLAFQGHFIFRFRTKESRRRLRQVLGPAPTDKEIRSMAWISFRNLAFNIVELLRAPKITKSWIAQHIDGQETFDHIRSSAQERGMVFALPHMGNWDLAGISVCRMDLPVFFIARRQKNPLADEFLNQMREQAGGQTVLNDSSVLRNTVRRLKNKEVMAILPDVRNRTPALPIPFLGATANIGGGMALFARSAGVPITPIVITRVGWTQHRWEMLEEVYPDPTLAKKEDWQRMTELVLSRFDAHIRAHPEQYFWFNKRWVLDPLPKN